MQDFPAMNTKSFKHYWNKDPKTRLALLLSTFGLLLFILLASLAPFKDKLLSALYPKTPSQAADLAAKKGPVSFPHEVNIRDIHINVKDQKFHQEDEIESPMGRENLERLREEAKRNPPKTPIQKAKVKKSS